MNSNSSSQQVMPAQTNAPYGQITKPELDNFVYGLLQNVSDANNIDAFGNVEGSTTIPSALFSSQQQTSRSHGDARAQAWRNSQRS